MRLPTVIAAVPVGVWVRNMSRRRCLMGIGWAYPNPPLTRMRARAFLPTNKLCQIRMLLTRSPRAAARMEYGAASSITVTLTAPRLILYSCPTRTGVRDLTPTRASARRLRASSLTACTCAWSATRVRRRHRHRHRRPHFAGSRTATLAARSAAADR